MRVVVVTCRVWRGRQGGGGGAGAPGGGLAVVGSGGRSGQASGERQEVLLERLDVASKVLEVLGVVGGVMVELFEVVRRLDGVW